MRLLIISSHDDAHIPFVTKHLAKNCEVLIIDPFGDVGKSDISFSFAKGKMSIFYGEQDISTIDSVWYRKPSQLYVEDLNIPKDYHVYCEDALQRHLATIRRYWPNALWVSPFEHIVSAGDKPKQLIMAHKLGFDVPETLSTGDSKKARNFLRKHDTCIAKPQGTDFPMFKVMMARKISLADNLEFGGLHTDPMIFQQYIKPAYELRVTVVKDKAFAAKVSGEEIGDDATFRDWRYSHINSTFEAVAFTINDTLQKKCVQLVKNMGLVYGAIDLIVDEKGTEWFLEINPNGQWAFIEETTKQPIGQAIASYLQGK